MTLNGDVLARSHNPRMLGSEDPARVPKAFALLSGIAAVLPPPSEPVVAGATEPEPAELQARAGGPSTILLVEDNRGDIRLVREALAKSSISLQLSIAHDGIQALRILHSSARKPALILLDLNLPGMDGLSFVRRLKADPTTRHLPVVAVTAHPDRYRETELMSAGCAAYLVKPIDMTRLMAELKQASGR